MDMKQALMEVINLAEEASIAPADAAGDKNLEEIMLQEELAIQKVKTLYEHLFE